MESSLFEVYEIECDGTLAKCVGAAYASTEEQAIADATGYSGFDAYLFYAAVPA